jgi:hypothetical protein
MAKTLTTTALAIALAGTTAVSMGTAFAVDAVVTFDPGTVRYGYTDGYWSNDHVWHKWESPKYIETYRARQGAVYHEWKHDRDPDMGWVEIHK